MSKAQVAEGTTMVVRRSDQLEASQLQELEDLLISGDRISEVVDDQSDVSAEIIRQILEAGSDDEVKGILGGSAIGWRKLENLPVRLINFSWRPSTFEEGSNVFFVVRATSEADGPEGVQQGDKLVLTTGSRNVLAQLVNMAKRGVLLNRVVAIKRSERPTKNGFHPLHLEVLEGYAVDDSNPLDEV